MRTAPLRTAHALPAGSTVDGRSRVSTFAESTYAGDTHGRDVRAPLLLAEDAQSWRHSSNAWKNALVARTAPRIEHVQRALRFRRSLCFHPRSRCETKPRSFANCSIESPLLSSASRNPRASTSDHLPRAIRPPGTHDRGGRGDRHDANSRTLTSGVGRAKHFVFHGGFRELRLYDARDTTAPFCVAVISERGLEAGRGHVRSEQAPSAIASRRPNAPRSDERVSRS